MIYSILQLSATIKVYYSHTILSGTSLIRSQRSATARRIAEDAAAQAMGKSLEIMGESFRNGGLCAYIYICIYTCIDLYVYVYIYMHNYAYMGIYGYMYVLSVL